MTSSRNHIVHLNVGGAQLATTLATLLSDKGSLLYQWFSDPEPPLPLDKSGAYFIDRDPSTFQVILNFLRLRSGGQLWEACLPKDPDRLALLTQEADYFYLNPLRDQALTLLQTCSERSDMDYFNQMLVESKSCPMGLSAILGAAKKQQAQKKDEGEDSDDGYSRNSHSNPLRRQF